MNDTSLPARTDWTDGALPGLGPSPSKGFVIHALAALGALLVLNWMVVTSIPFAVAKIGSSYLIFFYHLPAAISMGLLYTALLVFSIAYLRTKRAVWDRRARAAAGVGFAANMVLLVTGSTWAKAAWNAWWVWTDPRLMSAAVMSLIYVGYLMLQGAVEEPQRRRQISAVYGILAFVNLPVVHYSIQWFGQTQHPMQFDALSDASVVSTKYFAEFAFFLLYAALFRWSFDRLTRTERLEDALQRVRRVEERTQP